jgi:hypothetical protein
MFLPLLVSPTDPQIGEEHLIDEFTDSIGMAYSFGPPYGERLVTWEDLARMRVPRRALRRTAMDNLTAALDRLRIHGQPPSLMLSFDGLESSVLLVDEFWADMWRSVPGELAVGVPARDVVIFTGTESEPGMEKAQRAVDRVFFAGDQHLLSRDLLVWRQGTWVAHGPAAPVAGPQPPQPRYPARWPEHPPMQPSAGWPAGPDSAPWPDQPRQARHQPPVPAWVPLQPPAPAPAPRRPPDTWGPQPARRMHRPSGPRH